jgi:hypothetical protein
MSHCCVNHGYVGLIAKLEQLNRHGLYWKWQVVTVRLCIARLDTVRLSQRNLAPAESVTVSLVNIGLVKVM